MMNVLVRKLKVGSVGGGSRPEAYSWLAPYSLRAMIRMYICTEYVSTLCTCLHYTPYTNFLLALLPIAMYT